MIVFFAFVFVDVNVCVLVGEIGLKVRNSKLLNFFDVWSLFLHAKRNNGTHFICIYALAMAMTINTVYRWLWCFRKIDVLVCVSNRVASLFIRFPLVAFCQRFSVRPYKTVSCSDIIIQMIVAIVSSHKFHMIWFLSVQKANAKIPKHFRTINAHMRKFCHFWP